MRQSYLLHIHAANQIQWKTSILYKKNPTTYVEIVLDDVVQRTRVIKQNMSPKWSEIFTLSARDSTSTLTLRLIQKSSSLLVKDLCVGEASIELRALLRMCESNKDANLDLKSPKAMLDDIHRGSIVLRLSTVDSLEAAKTGIINAHQDTCLRGLDSSAASGILKISDAMGYAAQPQSDFLVALMSVISKLDTFVQILDKTAKIHPYANFAWQATSSLYKAVRNQQKRDEQLLNLLTIMDDVYSFVDTIRSMPKKLEILEETIAKILKQTVECTIFIREYTGHGFGARLITQTISNSTRKIADFVQAFTSLKSSFDADVVLQTAFVSTWTLDGVEKLVQMENLKLLNPIQMDASSRPECLVGTRQDILASIIAWLTTPSDEQNILWLYGLAGAGKSTISTTIAEYFRELCRLGAFVFFDRNDRNHSDPNAVIRTLAHRLASFHPSIRSAICAVIEKDETIIGAPIRRQATKLLLEPLQSIKELPLQGPIIIIIDALDECGDSASRRSLLALLSQEFSKLPSAFRILITSRAESDISAAFSERPNVSRQELHVTTDSSAADIRLFLHSEMVTIRQRHKLASDWPGEVTIQDLVQRSTGLFIWASIAVNFILEGYDPQEQLDILLRAGSQGKAGTALDSLYTTALKAVGKWDSAKFCADFRSVVGAMLVGRVPLSDEIIDKVSGVGDCERILSHLRCVLLWERGKPIRILHASFSDYLTNPNRCGNYPWMIDVSAANEALAQGCLQLMQTYLHFNICGLESSYVSNKDVPDLAQRIEMVIPTHLAYACQFWADHVQAARRSSILLTKVKDFMYTHFLHWLEVMSLIDAVPRVSPALLKVTRWSKGNDMAPDLAEFATDASRFVTTFKDAISRSTPHIYLSALPFCPSESKVWKTFRDRFPHTLAVETNRALFWPPQLFTLDGHTSRVSSVAFSPDGKRITSGSWDYTIRVWDAETGDLVSGPFQGHTSRVSSVAFSPDSQSVASGSWDCTIRIWDAETGDLVSGPFKGHISYVTSVAFSPDSRYIASGSGDNTVRVWNVQTGSLALGPIQGHTHSVTSVIFSPDCTQIASGSGDNTVRIWDAQTGILASGPFQGHTHVVTSVAFSPDGKHIASSSGDKTVRVWCAKTGVLVSGPFQGHSSQVTSISFSPDCKRIVSCSRDRTIRLWDAFTGVPISNPLQGHTEDVMSVVFSPDGRRIVSGSRDRTIRIWDAETMDSDLNLGPFQGHTSTVTSVAFSPDSKYVVSGSMDNTIRVWDSRTSGLILGPFHGHTSKVTSVAFSPDGRYIVSGSGDMSVRLWNVQTGDLVFRPFQGHTNLVTSVAFSPDGNYIVSGSADNTVRLWDARTGFLNVKPFQAHTNWVTSVAFSPAGRHIASGSLDCSICVWDMQTGDLVSGPFQGHTSEVTSIAFLPDGRRIASGSGDRTIRIWDLGIGGLISEPFQGHTEGVTSLTSSPDGKLIASGSWDRSIRLWDAETGDLILCPFQGHTGKVTSIALSPDGKHITSGSEDYTIRVWNVELVSELCEGMSHSKIIAPHAAQFGFCDNSKWDGGWIISSDSSLLFWIPPPNRKGLCWPRNTTVMCEQPTKLDCSQFVHGTSWQLCAG